MSRTLARARRGRHSGPPTSRGTSESESQADEHRDEAGKFLSREQASDRKRLRETEAERDELRKQLDRLQTGEVERLASTAGLQVPGDVWTFGATLDTLRGEDGDVDADMVSGVVDAILKDRPQLRDQPVGDLGIGASALGIRPPKVGLSQLLKPGRT